MIRKMTVAGALTAMLALSAMPAFAEHPHLIDTPGTCVDRAGKGFGTGESHDDFTGFHNRVHMGTPGTHAFVQPNNPVSIIGKALCQ